MAEFTAPPYASDEALFPIYAVGSLTITSELHLYKPVAIYKGLLMQIVGMILVVDHAHPATVSRHEDIYITVQGIAVILVTYDLSHSGSLTTHIVKIWKKIEVLQARECQHRPSSFSTSDFSPW